VWGAVGEGVAQQVFQGSVGVKVALEVSVVAVGDVGGVGVLGACELGDGFAGRGAEFGVGELVVGVSGFGACGVQGCGVDELLEVVYWMCVVVFPVGLSYLAMFGCCHSGEGIPDGAFVCQGVGGMGVIKMADVRGFPLLAGGTQTDAQIGSPREAGGTLKTATFNIPTPTPLEKQNPHRVSLSAL
jgi:hypothetical protein